MCIHMTEGLRASARKLHSGASASTFARLFAKDTAGNIGMIFAMMIVPATAFTGMAIDYSRAFNVKSEVQQVIDASVLTSAKHFQMTGDAQASINKGKQWFASAMAARRNNGKETGSNSENVTLTESSVTFEGKVTFAANVNVPTAFLKLVNVNEVEANVKAEASVPVEAKDVEMAVVFDVTGSMNSNNKLTTAKLAANDLIDILMPEAPHENLVRISLVPFSQMVNVGDYSAAATGQPAEVTYDAGGWREVCIRRVRGDCRETEWRWVSDWKTKYRKNCTAERMNSVANHAYDDALPGTAETNFPVFWTSSSTGQDSSCTPNARMMPLTDDKLALKSAVTALTGSGGTAGHIGTAWGWYTISPNWVSLWPTESQPAPFDNTKRLKAVIIMSDGDFNFNYSTSYGSAGNLPSSGNGSSKEQALEVCANMKAQGVEVFAVGVELQTAADPADARDTMLRCASSPNHLFERHFYDTLTNLQLRNAFQDIATRVSAASGVGAGAVMLSK